MPIAFAILLSLSLLSPLANADAGGACGPPALIIAIDIGHTPKKPGAVSARGIGVWGSMEQKTGLSAGPKLTSITP